MRIFERQHFPRFSIGESLLAYCLDIIEEAGMSRALLTQFRTEVNSWYDGRFQTMLFHKQRSPEISHDLFAPRRLGVDDKNPFVDQRERRLQSLYELTRNLTS